jgi:hypothetical protein
VSQKSALVAALKAVPQSCIVSCDQFCHRAMGDAHLMHLGDARQIYRHRT